MIFRLATMIGILALLSTAVWAGEIKIPIEGKYIVVEDPQFNENDWPALTFMLVNETIDSWRELELQFDIDGICNGERQHWTRKVVSSLGYMEKGPVRKNVKDVIVGLVGDTNGCKTQRIEAKLLIAESLKGIRIDLTKGTRVDLVAERETRERAKARQRRIEEEEREKKEAAEDAKRNREYAELKRRLAEDQARRKKICSDVYKTTSERKVSDLTVKEEQLVRACQLLGAYQP